jgi:hypothetical protein
MLSRSQELQDFLLQVAQFGQGHFCFLAFSETVGTLHQDFAAAKDCGLGHLDTLEKNLVVGFLYGGFVFQLPSRRIALWNRTGKFVETPSSIS